MSALFGIIDAARRPVSEGAIGAMASALRRRGPDGCRIVVGDGFALGHGMLDVSAGGAQLGELVDAQDIVIVADCRLDNRAELLDFLGLGAQSSDTELILAAYRYWGDLCAAHLLGDFAFSLWDRASRRLYCARDHFGVKPLVYCTVAHSFVFASEIQALFASGRVAKAIRPEGIADFLADLEPDLEETLYHGVFRLPPGHFGVWENEGRWRVSAYWRLAPYEVQPYDDAPGRFRALLETAVRDRMRGGPVGAMLSGGLDSSSIVGLARAIRGDGATEPLAIFSMVFDDTPERNERPYIEAVLKSGGLAPHYLQSNDIRCFDGFSDLLHEQAGLFGTPNLACSRRVYHAASGAGVRVLLDGHGGDEVAPAGVGRIRELARAGRWLKVWRELKGVVQTADEQRLDVYLWLLKAYGPASRPLSWLNRARASIRDQTQVSGREAPLLAPHFATQTKVSERRRVRRQRPTDVPNTEAGDHLLVVRGPLQSNVLEILDLSAAAAGVEVRYPFWDKRVVEFCLSLRPEEKLDGGWGRLVLRKGLEGYLPREIQWRAGKFDFMPAALADMRHNHTSLIDQVLEDASGQLSEFINLSHVRAARDRLKSSPKQPDGYDVQAIWRTVALHFWLNMQG